MADPDEVYLVLRQGKTWRTTIDWVGSDGEPIPLAGVTSLRMQVRRDYADQDTTTPLLDLTLGAGLTITGNTIEVHVASAVTAAIPAGVYYTDLEVTWPSGDDDEVFHGRVQVTPEVTR